MSTSALLIASSSVAVAAALALVPASALANHVDAEVSISHASPIFVSVSNQSESTNANERMLTMTTPAELTVQGAALCKDASVIQSVQLHFGLNFIESAANGHTLWGVWDNSAPLQYESSNSASWSITHDVDLVPTWALGTLITLQPNAVKVVEDHLKAYVNGGGSAIDFLRADAAFETTFTAHATVACERNGNVFFDTVAKNVTMHILYKGDPNIMVQIAGQSPSGVTPKQPTLPAYAIYAPQLRGAIIIGKNKRRNRDVREPIIDDGGERFVDARFPIYSIEGAGYDDDLWSGYVSYGSEEVCGEAQMAVTADGACVLVEAGCLPQEFASCRTLDGCCAGL